MAYRRSSQRMSTSNWIAVDNDGVHLLKHTAMTSHPVRNEMLALPAPLCIMMDPAYKRSMTSDCVRHGPVVYLSKQRDAHLHVAT